MAKPAPLKTLEVDPMAWRSITAMAQAANDPIATAGRGPHRPGLWIVLASLAALALVYHVAVR